MTLFLQDIGALLMVGLPGPEMDDSTRSLIRESGVRNFIIFKRNVENPAQLKKLCAEIIADCINSGYGRPLISIDQEGGTVARLPEPWTQFPDARVLAASENPESELSIFAGTCATELLEAGINMNLAPVLDICPAGEGYFMERRSLSGDPVKAARLGGHVISEMQKNGLAACAKHFPGLGSARLDPHLELPLVGKKADLLLSEDLLPFREACRAGVAAVMTSHTIYQDIDPEHPATLSGKILTGILRENIGYTGLVITDDLEMGAIENERSVAEAALRSFEAGADLLLICHDHQKIRETCAIIHHALASGRVSEKQITDAAARIEKVRHRFA
ncbi:MAG: beta-N-acetylhexosaminidase [Proteobacteria bacterium]|nr:beta-N-acetylhexosaminidase [Pseudomonadota bacterium]MBU1737220.1 beta-N-acetylhexosaminidase [Pseudomonadota bacterium]